MMTMFIRDVHHGMLDFIPEGRGYLTDIWKEMGPNGHFTIILLSFIFHYIVMKKERFIHVALMVL